MGSLGLTLYNMQDSTSSWIVAVAFFEQLHEA
jgi:hypothetical protein